MELWQALRPAMKSTLETNRQRAAASAKMRVGREEVVGVTRCRADRRRFVRNPGVERRITLECGIVWPV